MSANKRHPYHIVEPSPQPISMAFWATLLVILAVCFMHGYEVIQRRVPGGFYWSFLFIFSVIVSAGVWFRDVIKEGLSGYHTRPVQKNLRLGFMLFIVSEVMFFFAFFWAFFHSSLSPAIQIGCTWPPSGIRPLNPWTIPFYNTGILLLSGVTITIVHHFLIAGGPKDEIFNFFVYTIGLAILFTLLQLYEYKNRPFSISDGIYGSTFFMSTGFHGFHVFVGTIFIGVCFRRFYLNHFTRDHHVGFEARAWYWHFVDVVWLFLFVMVYWWGNSSLILCFR